MARRARSRPPELERIFRCESDGVGPDVLTAPVRRESSSEGVGAKSGSDVCRASGASTGVVFGLLTRNCTHYVLTDFQTCGGTGNVRPLCNFQKVASGCTLFP